MSQYPHGVPSPYTTHVHPYPTRFHGGIWRRPVFGMPWVRAPFNVIRPSQMASSQHGAAGLGLDWDVGTGVFRRPRVDGGGVFNNVSGLGAAPATAAGTFFAGAAIAGLITYFLIKKKAGG